MNQSQIQGIRNTVSASALGYPGSDEKKNTDKMEQSVSKILMSKI